MKPPPQGWPRISSALFYDDAATAIDWLCRAFDFQVRLKVEGENGRIEHSELELGDDGLIMVGSTGGAEQPKPAPRKSPRSLEGANTQALCVCVDDVESHHQRAAAAGAQILQQPHTVDYGEDYWTDRSYSAVDLEGHQWWFFQRVRDQKPHGR